MFFLEMTTTVIIETTKINTAIEPNSGITEVPIISIVVPPAPKDSVRVLCPAMELSLSVKSAGSPFIITINSTSSPSDDFALSKLRSISKKSCKN